MDADLSFNFDIISCTLTKFISRIEIFTVFILLNADFKIDHC